MPRDEAEVGAHRRSRSAAMLVSVKLRRGEAWRKEKGRRLLV
jgi:hypothetical protein